jgi:two-component system, OmpR family, sensor histidine kinase VicK
MENPENAILLKEMAEHSDEIFFIFNPDELKFIYINDAFEHFTKKKCGDLYDHPKLFMEMIHPEDQQYVRKNFNALLTNTVNSFLDFRIVRADGVERWVRLKVYPLLKKNRIRYLTGILEDDSARKLGIFNMQKINGWKDATLEILAHDLRGPISIVEGLAKAIGKKLPESENREIHEWTRMIAEISRRNLNLVHDIITMESLDTVNVEVNKERMELVSEVNEVMNVYLNSQLKAEKRFVFTHSHDHIYAEVDCMKYLQIVNNLVSNAIKFTGKAAEITVHLEQLESTVLTVVSDNGIGIPKSLQPVLFCKYTKAGRKGQDGQKPVGLGMWIVKSYTEAHGGRVWFESKENAGSKFYVEIPLCRKMEEI